MSSALATGRQRIRHVRVEQNFPSLVAYIKQRESLSIAEIGHLLELGAIYLNGRRQMMDVSLHTGDFLRLHLEPKRFSIENLELEKLVISIHSEFIVADKPHGLPTHPTLDNAKENLLYLLSTIWGPLWPVHRLDHLTAGLIVFGRNAKFARHFQGWLKNGLVKKHYRAHCIGAPPLGTHIHNLTMGDGKQRRAELVIHRVLPITGEEDLFAVYIQLITGRTHQIRSQLAQLGTPIKGDTLYGPPDASPSAHGQLELISIQIVLPGPKGEQKSFFRPER